MAENISKTWAHSGYRTKIEFEQRMEKKTKQINKQQQQKSVRQQIKWAWQGKITTEMIKSNKLLLRMDGRTDGGDTNIRPERKDETKILFEWMPFWISSLLMFHGSDK